MIPDPTPWAKPSLRVSQSQPFSASPYPHSPTNVAHPASHPRPFPLESAPSPHAGRALSDDTFEFIHHRRHPHALSPAIVRALCREFVPGRVLCRRTPLPIHPSICPGDQKQRRRLGLIRIPDVPRRQASPRSQSPLAEPSPKPTNHHPNQCRAHAVTRECLPVTRL